tara:strand:- start:484 stop:642 length:159 start_codon:yes stop_codon:yes gene_type:complete
MIGIQTLKEVIIKTERILGLKARDIYIDREIKDLLSGSPNPYQFKKSGQDTL